MTNPPRTIEEAKKYRYGTCEGLFDGWAYVEHHCAHEVDAGYQCSRNPGHGPANLYCKQHAKMVERGIGEEHA